MRQIPRSQWPEWCDHLSHDIEKGLCLLDRDTRTVVSVDYAPLDDVLEVDYAGDRKGRRQLIDHPTEISIDDEDPLTVIMIAGTIDSVRLVRPQISPLDMRPYPGLRPSRIESVPEAMVGTYYEG